MDDVCGVFRQELLPLVWDEVAISHLGRAICQRIAIVSQRWYTRPDFKIFAETEIERRRSHGISSMSALCSRAEEVPDDDDAPPCELPSERLAAATKIVGFGALVAGCVVPVVLSAGLLAGALDVPRFLWATFGGLAIVFSPVVLVVVVAIAGRENGFFRFAVVDELR